tara:strand:+ start:12140 stop:13219 length:1080 start_codon:yes stop_codon:yes gene_type:complete
MAISPDVLASALQELMPGYSELFVKWHPILDKVVSKGNIERQVATGPYREFAVVTDGPGTVTQILTGSEVIAGGRNQNAVRGSTYAPRLIYAFDVPGKDLAEANGAMDLARIIQHYPELALGDFHERIARQLAVGDGLDVGGFLTLNGATTYNPNGAARTGALEFSSQAAQVAAANSVFGLNKGTTPGWYNQYGNITSFATNGRSTMRQVYYAASRQGKTMGPVDLMMGDEASYLNYIEDLDDHVRISKVEGEKGPANIRQGVRFLDADFFLEDALDITAPAFAGTAAANGVIYLMKSASWYAYTMGADDSRETKGDFSVRGPFRIPEQDVFRYEIVLNMGMNTNQLRCNGVVTGGATP